MKQAKWVVLLAAVLAGQAAPVYAQQGTITFQGAIVEPTCELSYPAGGRPALQSRCPVPGGTVVRTLDLRHASGHQSRGSPRIDVRPVPNPADPGAAQPAGYIVTATYR